MVEEFLDLFNVIISESCLTNGGGQREIVRRGWGCSDLRTGVTNDFECPFVLFSSRYINYHESKPEW